MNLAGCANCFLHGWKQVEDQSALQRCTKCKLIQYCGRECQAEHWKKVHKKQCRYFADPTKAQKWGHNEEACVICLQADEVGMAEICRATNPNYECILKEKFPSHLYHPHPFPVTGQPGHTYEKVVIILWQLFKKLELTQPGVVRSYRGKFVKVFAELKMIRLYIWNVRKIGGQSEWRLKKFNSPSLDDLLLTISKEFRSNDSMEDLIKIIQLVEGMLLHVYICENLQVLLNPLADIPADLKPMVSLALSNTTNYLTVANQVLEALTAQVVPYQDLVRIVCGDSLEKRCHFCSENTPIDRIGGIYGKGSCLFNCLFMEIYCCGTKNCREKAMSMMMQDYLRFNTTVQTTVRERESAQLQCDCCLKLPPSKGGHRCSKCLTVTYCSTACRDQDWKIHKEFCEEEAEERKKKFGSSARRKEARDILDHLGNGLERFTLEELEKGINIPGACEVVSKFKLKDPSKKAKK